jgi:multicomponent Na+:H+ antiporter subunit D
MAVSSPSADLSAALVLQPAAALDWLVILPVAWCIGIGAILMMVRHRTGLQPLIAIAALCVLAGIDATLLWHVSQNGPVTMVMGRRHRHQRQRSPLRFLSLADAVDGRRQRRLPDR